MEAVLESRFPVAILLAFDETLNDGGDGGVLAGELHGLEEQARQAEIIEVDGVRQELGFGQFRGSEREFAKQHGGAIDQLLVGVVGEAADEEFGGLFGAFAEVDLAELADGLAGAVGQLEGVAREFHGLAVKLGGGEVEFDQALDPMPQAARVVEEAGGGRIGGAGQQALEVLLKFWFQVRLRDSGTAYLAALQYGVAMAAGQIESAKKWFWSWLDRAWLDGAGFYSWRRAVNMAGQQTNRRRHAYLFESCHRGGEFAV